MGDFRGAASTDYYLDGEKRLLRPWLQTAHGGRVLKLDLWNEARNTDILAWIAEQGFSTFAVDLAWPVVSRAAQRFTERGLPARFVVGHLYSLPFQSESFDLLYTMGTIEHVADMDRCVAEIRRVLKPGGIAVVGLPNRHDPFLRPLLVALMSCLGVYPYGLEQCLSASQLRTMLTHGGLEVLQHDGLLFMPGVLRMAELWLLDRLPWLSRTIGGLHRPFRRAAEVFPFLHRHGYLVACIARRPR